MTTIIDDIIAKDFKNLSNGTGRKKDYMGDLIVIKARGLKNWNLSFIGQTIKFHISQDPEYGTIKVMFKISYYGEYKISIGDMTNFDTLMIIGLNKNKNIIEKVFAIPKKELSVKRFITIISSTITYQKFEIDKTRYVQIYENLKTGKGSILEDGNIVQ